MLIRSLPSRHAASSLPLITGLCGTTEATITASICIAIMLACLVDIFESAYLGWIDQHFAADLFVGRGTRVRIIAGPPIAPDVAEAIARIPGVSSVEPFRVVSMRMGDRPVFLQGISVPDRLIHGGLPMVEGDFNAAAPVLEAGPGSVRAAILARLGPGSGTYVVTAHDFRDGVRAVLDQFFGSAWALELVAALVGVIGVVNAQVATVLDRTTEIAMLRTIGVSLR